jgi:hypothetical protein
MQFRSKAPLQEPSPSRSLLPSRLLSRDEVETTYGITKRYLELAACKGGGPVFVKVGRLTRYRVQDIEDWIYERRFVNTSAVATSKGRD